jgi:hypothetical protein
MKTCILLLSMSILFLASCNKEEKEADSIPVERVIRPLVINYTATWCGPCGQSGGPAFNAMLDSGKEGTLLTAIKAYTNNSSTGMSSLGSSRLFSAFSVSGIPAFWVNNNQSSVSTNQIIASATKIQADSNSIVAGLGLKKAIVGDSIIVDARTKFFKNGGANIDYALAIYVVEDNIVGYQKVGGTDNATYLHRNVLRTSAANNYYGTSINNGVSVLEGSEFLTSYKIFINPAWNKANLKVIGVIWKSGSNPYKVVNTNIAK